MYSAALAISEGATSRNGTTISRIGRHINSISVGGEVGHQGAVCGDIEGVIGIGRDHIAVLRPVGEGIAGSSSSDYGTALAISEGATARYGTAISRIGRHINSIGVGGEVGHKGMVCIHDESVVGIGGNHRAILGPIRESVARVGRGRDRARLSFGESATTCHTATFGRVG